MRIFEFIINPEDSELGMKAISLVDKPAMESEFIAFSKEKKQLYFKVDDRKYIVGGLALVPEKLIYRVDESTGEEYLGYFSAETIEMIMDKFMNESTSGTLKDVNFQHNSDDKVPAHLVESFILRTEDMVKAVQAMGIQDAVLGSWYVAYKFDSFEAYDKAIAGGFTGYSVEVVLQRELKLNKNQIKNNIIMTKVKNFITKFKTLLEEIETSGIFEDVVVPESGKSLRIGDVGTPVTWISVDEAGAEMEEAALEGEYILEDGRIVVVDANGNLAEIKEAGTPIAPIPEESLAEVPPVEALPEVPAEEAPVEEAPASDVSAKTLGEIVDVSKDGEYTISVVVAGGVITEATVEAAQNLIQETLSARETEITTLKAEVERLKTELEKPVTKPAFVEFTTPRVETKTKEELAKMNNLDLVKHRLGLEK